MLQQQITFLNKFIKRKKKMKIRCIKNSLGIYTTFKYSTFLAKLALCDEEGLDVRNLVGYMYIYTRHHNAFIRFVV